MELYSFFNSSTSYRVRIALELKKQSYIYKGVNIRVGEQRSLDYVEINPAKGVPILVDNNGFTVSQSMAILQYLDDKYPEPRLIPYESKEKARVLELSNLIACDMHPVNNLKVLGYLQTELEVSNTQKTEWYKHWINEGFVAVESLLVRHGHGQYCFGELPTLADCCLVPQVANALRFGCDLSNFKKVMAVYQHCIKQPAFQRAEPKEQPDYIA